YINIDNEKMSKSRGNFVLTHDLIKQHDPEVIRFLMLSVHYRHPINFSDELLEGAKNSLGRIKTAYDTLGHRRPSSLNLESDTERWLEKINAYRHQFEQEMDDDFNTANAISVLFELTKEANLYLESKQTQVNVIDAFQRTVSDLLGVLGLSAEKEEMLLDDEVEALIQERVEARKSRDFKRADEIRDTLKEKQIILEDTPQGTRWKRG